jgi:hypothetical protein
MLDNKAAKFIFLERFRFIEHILHSKHKHKSMLSNLNLPIFYRDWSTNLGEIAKFCFRVRLSSFTIFLNFSKAISCNYKSQPNKYIV